MDSVYTTTITDEARRRGISVTVIDPSVPIFSLSHKGSCVRCYRSLTDRVGAVTFHLTQNKHLAASFLRGHGFPVPAHQLYTNMSDAYRFLDRYRSIVVKPCSQWGARGVSTHISDSYELRLAVRKARRYEKSVLLEECVSGTDQRLIFIDYRFVAALQRTPAFISGNGSDTLRSLIQKKNAETRKIDPVNTIPLDRETLRCLKLAGHTYDSVPLNGRHIQVRFTSNYHTGGSVKDISTLVSSDLKALAEKIVLDAQLPVTGVDFLVDEKSGKAYIIELAPDLAISPRSGKIVAQRFLDYLFPETRQT